MWPCNPCQSNQQDNSTTATLNSGDTSWYGTSKITPHAQKSQVQGGPAGETTEGMESGRRQTNSLPKDANENIYTQAVGKLLTDPLGCYLIKVKEKKSCPQI